MKTVTCPACHKEWPWTLAQTPGTPRCSCGIRLGFFIADPTTRTVIWQGQEPEDRPTVAAAVPIPIGPLPAPNALDLPPPPNPGHLPGPLAIPDTGVYLPFWKRHLAWLARRK
jgi:hypothetical protein